MDRGHFKGAVWWQKHRLQLNTSSCHRPAGIWKSYAVLSLWGHLFSAFNPPIVSGINLFEAVSKSVCNSVSAMVLTGR